MKVQVYFDLDAELKALHEELVRTNLEPYVTQKQVQLLASLMGQCITNKKKRREIRIWILNQIAGKAMLRVAGITEITSTKNITGTMASILIELFLSDEEDWKPSLYAKRLIEAMENRFEAEFGTGENNTNSVGVAA